MAPPMLGRTHGGSVTVAQTGAWSEKGQSLSLQTAGALLPASRTLDEQAPSRESAVSSGGSFPRRLAD